MRTTVLRQAGPWPAGLGMLVVAATLFCTSGASEAQVFKCRSGSGQLVYSDAPCPTGHDGGLIEKAKSQSAIARERQRAADAEQLKQARIQAEAEAEPQRNASAPRPSTPPQAGYEQRLHERNAAVKSTLQRRQPSKSRQQAEVEEPPTTAMIRECKGAWCTDFQGNNYHRGGSQNFMTGPNGTACTRTGNSVTCQ